MTIIHNTSLESSKITFNLTRRYDEHNLSAEIYHKLKLLGIKSHLEYKHEHSIFDLVILNVNAEIKFIVEVKNKEHKKTVRTNTKQFAKYSQYNIPIIFIYKFSQIQEAVDYIQANLDK